MNDEKKSFKKRTQEIAQWKSPEDDELFEMTFLNRGKFITRWDQKVYTGRYPSISKFETYWTQIINHGGFQHNTENPIISKYKYHWMIKRIVPNDIQLNFFENDHLGVWDYFINREDLIPLRWSNTIGDYYKPLIKRKNLKNGITESLCPYCHCDSAEEAVFFDDDLFLSYQYHLREEHFVFNKGSAEASPFIFHRVNNIIQVSCQNCNYKYRGHTLDLNEYIDHVNICKANYLSLDSRIKVNHGKVNFSECDILVLYDQSSFNVKDDVIFENQTQEILKEMKSRELEDTKRKKRLIQEKYKNIRRLKQKRKKSRSKKKRYKQNKSKSRDH